MARWGQRFLVLCTAWLITGLCFGSAFARSLQSGQELFILRVIAPTPAAIAQLTDGRYDLLEARQGDALFVLGDQTFLRSLRAEGFEVSVYARLPERRESFAPFTYFGGYSTVAEHYAHLNAVAAMHPELATVVDTEIPGER